MSLNKSTSILFIFLCFLTLTFFSGCAENSDDKTYINLSNNMSWAETNAFSAPEDALFLHFEKIKNAHDRNFKHTLGTQGRYIWVKINFSVPEELENQDLGFVIEYLHFAEKAWINGRYLGQYGAFPPHEKSALWVAHYYEIPREILVPGENTILLKVWSHGAGKIAKRIYITDTETAVFRTNMLTFIHSKLYLVFEGGMFAAFLLFTVMYLGRRKEGYHMVFALTNLYTMQLAFMLFAQENPIYNHVNFNYLAFVKYFECCCFIYAFYFMQSFVIRYIYDKISTMVTIVRLMITFTCVVCAVCAPSYNVLTGMTIPIFCLLGVELAITLFYLIKALTDPDKRRRAVIIICGFAPLLICAFADVVLRIETFELDSPPFHGFYGWQMTIVYFMTALTIRFNKTLKVNEYLNKHLTQEVDKKTSALKESKEELEHQIERNEKDLKMASIVQQKLFPAPVKSFVGWDMSVAYEPLNEVSGDLYDYYSVGNILDGFSIFDVSGHGISSSLLTVLAKNILSQQLKQNRFTMQNVSVLMKDFNKKLIDAKGSVDNYLTGIICVVKKIESNGDCELQMANAGHPHPILYSAKNDKISEIRHEADKENFGAIGLYGNNVQFLDNDFTMSPGDILLAYTDGVTEAINQNGEQFGKVRMMEIVQQNHDKTSLEIQDLIMSEVYRFIGTKQRNDDITVIVLKREKPESFIEEIGNN